MFSKDFFPARPRGGAGAILMLCLGLLLLVPMQSFAMPVISSDESPQVRALLEQAWAAESGQGLRRNVYSAAVLYLQAGELGSAEGFYQAGLLRLKAFPGARSSQEGLCLLSSASQLGHERASQYLQSVNSATAGDMDACGQVTLHPATFYFDMTAYLSGQSADKRHVARLIRQLAPLYKVDTHLALAIAGAESNFNSRALSPKMAMGVMQLIPATAERFNVRNPYDPEQNIRGGLAYLRWLKNYFAGDVVRVIAAYNAGEGAVVQHSGVPPYRETMNYVARVMSYAGCPECAPGAGRPN